MQAQHGLCGGTRERRSPGQHFVDDATEGVDVGPVVQVAGSRRLLRTHVGGRPGRRDRARRVHVEGAGADRARDAEVGHDRLPILKQDVLGLDVAVHHALPVGIVERSGDFTQHGERARNWQRSFPLQPLAERLALDVGHHVIEQVAGRARVVQRQDVGMVKPGGGVDLPKEPLPADRGRDLGMHHLDRHAAVMLVILRQVDRSHPAATERVEQLVFAETRSGRQPLPNDPRQQRRGVGCGVLAEETFADSLDSAQPPLDLRLEERIAGAPLIDKCRTRPGREVERGVHDARDLGPALRLGGRVPHADISRYSQPRALIQSRWTVRRVTPSRSAVSSSVRPPK